jgi:hypothetical protein
MLLLAGWHPTDKRGRALADTVPVAPLSAPVAWSR